MRLSINKNRQSIDSELWKVAGHIEEIYKEDIGKMIVDTITKITEIRKRKIRVENESSRKKQYDAFIGPRATLCPAPGNSSAARIH